ncbi:MAG TPA: hypothetical protein VEL73_08355 [Mycobacteriales bacterium]|nr:hypothetical protein [Mycobacteriales bacterium]
MSVPSSHTRRIALVGALSALLATGAVLTAAPALAGEGSFGTAPASSGPAPGGTPSVQSVSVGRHAGFDRVVFRLTGPGLGYEATYTSRLTEDASGRTLPIAGSTVLTVTLHGTPWMTSPSPQVNVSPRFPALRQVRSAGEFEAVATYGIGQATKAGFRVFRLTGPDRIVVDVQHPASTAPSTQPAGGTVAPSAASTPAAATTGSGGAAGTSNGGLADTGARQPLPVALTGGLLVLAGLVVALVGVHVARRNG